MTGWESALERWRNAGLIDADADARIREFEASRVPETTPTSPGLRWPAIVAMQHAMRCDGVASENPREYPAVQRNQSARKRRTALDSWWRN